MNKQHHICSHVSLCMYMALSPTWVTFCIVLQKRKLYHCSSTWPNFGKLIGYLPYWYCEAGALSFTWCWSKAAASWLEALDIESVHMPILSRWHVFVLSYASSFMVRQSCTQDEAMLRHAPETTIRRTYYTSTVDKTQSLLDWQHWKWNLQLVLI